MDTIKDYLETEKARNRKYARLYKLLIQHAFGDRYDVEVGHHISFQPHGDVENLNEIPAADTVLFDFTIMQANFGVHVFLDVIEQLCRLKPGEREEYLIRLLQETEAGTKHAREVVDQLATA